MTHRGKLLRSAFCLFGNGLFVLFWEVPIVFFFSSSSPLPNQNRTKTVSLYGATLQSASRKQWSSERCNAVLAAYDVPFSKYLLTVKKHENGKVFYSLLLVTFGKEDILFSAFRSDKGPRSRNVRWVLLFTSIFEFINGRSPPSRIFAGFCLFVCFVLFCFALLFFFFFFFFVDAFLLNFFIFSFFFQFLSLFLVSDVFEPLFLLHPSLSLALSLNKLRFLPGND